MSVTITVECKDGDLSIKGTAHEASVNERKQSAIIMAALDGIGKGLEDGSNEDEIATLISGTIQNRMQEAKL